MTVAVHIVYILSTVKTSTRKFTISALEHHQKADLLCIQYFLSKKEIILCRIGRNFMKSQQFLSRKAHTLKSILLLENTE